MNTVKSVAERQRTYRQKRNYYADIGEVFEDHALSAIENIARSLGCPLDGCWEGNYQLISDKLYEQAHWRDSVQDRFPGDSRSSDAANHLRWLAAQVGEVDPGNRFIRLAMVVDAMASSTENFETAMERMNEDISELYRSIGFHHHYKSADEFLRAYCVCVVSALDRFFQIVLQVCSGLANRPIAHRQLGAYL